MTLPAINVVYFAIHKTLSSALSLFLVQVYLTVCVCADWARSAEALCNSPAVHTHDAVMASFIGLMLPKVASVRGQNYYFHLEPAPLR